MISSVIHQDVPVLAGLGVSAEVHLLADPDLGRRIVGILKNRDGTNWVSIMATGITGTPPAIRVGPRRSCPVEAAVWGPGAFWVNAEQITPAEYAEHPVHAGGAGSPS